MSLIRKMSLTPHEAKELVKDGFILKLISMGLNVDTYEVYVLGGK